VLLALQDTIVLMEALGSLAVNLGPAFEPYAPAVFDKAISILGQQVDARKAQVCARVFGVVCVWLCVFGCVCLGCVHTAWGSAVHVLVGVCMCMCMCMCVCACAA
jgi:hypothetical protein